MAVDSAGRPSNLLVCTRSHPRITSWVSGVCGFLIAASAHSRKGEGGQPSAERRRRGAWAGGGEGVRGAPPSRGERDGQGSGHRVGSNHGERERGATTTHNPPPAKREATSIAESGRGIVRTGQDRAPQPWRVRDSCTPWSKSSSPASRSTSRIASWPRVEHSLLNQCPLESAKSFTAG